MRPADARYHIPEMVAGLEWRLRHLVEHPAQWRLIDGQRVNLILGSLVVVQCPSGQLSTFGWDVDVVHRSEMQMVCIPADRVALKGMPKGWVWLARLMQGFEIELRIELLRLGRMTEAEVCQGSNGFNGYLQAIGAVMKHRLAALPHYRSMRQRIAASVELDPATLALACRIADTPAHLGYHTVMVSTYNRAVAHKDLLQQVWREHPHLLTFYAGMLEDKMFPSQGEPLQRLRRRLHDHLGSHGPYRLLLKTGPRQFALMRRFTAYLRHENYQDWLRLMHGLSPQEPVPMWLMRVLVSKFGNERQRMHLYAPHFWPRLPLWAQLVHQWVHVTQPSATELTDIDQVARWIVDGPCDDLDRRQRQQGWAGLHERAAAWHEMKARPVDPTPLPLASRLFVRHWEDWSLVPLCTDQALREEGELMGHCLGREHGPQPGPTTWFASLRHQGKRVLSCHFEERNGRRHLVTALGRFNVQPTHEQSRMLRQVLKRGTRQDT